MVDEDAEKVYAPFLINRALSHHFDTVMMANMMNLSSNISKRMHYDFLLGTVRSVKRPFKKWHKYIQPDDIDIIKENYDCSTEKALEILKLLTVDQVQSIKNKTNKGGVDNVRNHDRGNTKNKK